MRDDDAYFVSPDVSRAMLLTPAIRHARRFAARVRLMPMMRYARSAMQTRRAMICRRRAAVPRAACLRKEEAPDARWRAPADDAAFTRLR